MRLWRHVLRLTESPVLASSDVVERLVENHRRFLAFLVPRVGSREEAEDILQDAYVKGLARVESVRDEESVVAWFYRLLRNALVDHYRRRGAEARAIDRAGAEAETATPPADEEVMEAVCGCVVTLLDTLPPAYGAALRRVELDEVGVKDYAREAGITPNNAAVRLHRARAALRQQLLRMCGTCTEHGCENCSCGGPGRACD